MTSVEDTEAAVRAVRAVGAVGAAAAVTRESTVAIGTKPGHRCKATKLVVISSYIFTP
jgi:hypothetical protein